MQALIFNFSGHRVPTSTLENLKRQGYETIHIFSEVVHIDVTTDIGSQVEALIDKMMTKTNRHGNKVVDFDADLYFLPPAHATTSICLYQALEKLWGYPIPILVTGLERGSNSRSPRYTQYGNPFNLKGWVGRFRSELRKEYLLNDGVELIQV